MKLQSLVILGTGGSAYDIIDIVDAINSVAPTWQVAGFLDDSLPVGSTYLDLPILGAIQDAGKESATAFINSIGSDQSYRTRPDILDRTGLPLPSFATLVHPSTCVSKHAVIGADVYVNFGVTVGGNVRVGNHVSLCPSCIIGHDTIIDDYVMIAPGAIVSGRVHLGQNCYIGAGAMIRQNIHVGDRALVGMGSVVTRDVQRGATIVGNPAHEMRSR